MTFFPADPPPDAGPYEQGPRPWWAAPDDELPAIVPASAPIASSRHVAVALLGVHVYRSGVELRLERRLRRAGLSGREWREAVDRFMAMHMDATDAAGRLRYGLVLADGEQVVESGFGIPGSDPMAQPAGFSLMRQGGGGGGGDADYSTSEQLWLWPLPPAGELELVLQWPEMRIPESRHRVDLGDVDALAARAVSLWPSAEPA